SSPGGARTKARESCICTAGWCRRTRDRPQLTLGRLDGGIYFASRNPVAFSVKLEVMNERLHRALHLGAARGHDLGINEMGRTLPVRRPQLGNTLFHDADRLAHLFHADAVAVVTIAVLADRDVEIQLRIALVRLGLAQVPGGAATAHHHARETPSPG